MNEDPTEKLLRELTEENERLKKQLSSGKVDDADIQIITGKDGKDLSAKEREKLKKEFMEEMQAQMAENDREMNQMKMSYEEKLKNNTVKVDGHLAEVMKQKKERPHLHNLNFDPQLSNKIVHILKDGDQEIGSPKGQKSDITMAGPG